MYTSTQTTFLGKKWLLEIYPREPREGPPANGFGSWGDLAIRVLKKMGLVAALSDLGLGSIIKTMLPLMMKEASMG